MADDEALGDRIRGALARPRAGVLVVALALGGCAGDPGDQLAPCAAVPGGVVSVEFVSGLPLGDVDRGEAIFELQCARCHTPRRVDRGSRLFRDYPRLDCADYLGHMSDAYLATVILRGGEPFGLRAAMKPFEAELSRQQVADVVLFMRAAAGP